MWGGREDREKENNCVCIDVRMGSIIICLHCTIVHHFVNTVCTWHYPHAHQLLKILLSLATGTGQPSPIPPYATLSLRIRHITILYFKSLL